MSIYDQLIAAGVLLDQITNTLWYDVPFAYPLFWSGRKVRVC